MRIIMNVTLELDEALMNNEDEGTMADIFGLFATGQIEIVDVSVTEEGNETDHYSELDLKKEIADVLKEMAE